LIAIAVDPVSEVDAARGTLELRGNLLRSTTARLELRDASGSLVQRAYGSASGTVVDLTGLPRGFYIAVGDDHATLLVEVASPLPKGLSATSDRLASA